MNAILVIGEAAVREHSRRRLLVFFAIGSVAIGALLVLVVRDRSAGQVFGPGVGIAAIASLGIFQLFGAVGALAVSMGNVGQPFQTGEALPVLARPVARWQFAMGRLVASIVVIAGLCTLLAVVTQVVQLVASGQTLASFWGHYAVLLFNLAVIATCTTLLSTFLSNAVLAAIVGFVVYQVVGALGQLHRLVRISQIRGPVARVIEVAWYVSPKFLTTPLQARGAAAASRQVQVLLPENTPALILWASAYLVGLALLCAALAQRKET